jgi:polyisoprenoid-binding protein YceI
MALKQWELDLTHSSINFSVRHMVVSKVRGRFNRWSGTMSVDECACNTSSVDVKIETASIDTGDATRDGHLRSEDFLSAAKFPAMTFRSTNIERIAHNQLKMSGELTIRGITRPVVLDVEAGGRVRDPKGLQRVGFTARCSIDRKDFGITINTVLDVGGVVIGDRIEIEIDIEATRAGVEDAMCTMQAS